MQKTPPDREFERSPILEIVSYDLAVDLTGGEDTFSSRAEVRFRCRRAGAAAFADLHAAGVRSARLNGADLDIAAAYHPGRLELSRLAHENTLVVEADFGYASAGAGLHRVTGPDGSACVYSKAYPGGAPHIFCCFDQPDLRAPFTLSIRAPTGWPCLANAPLSGRSPGKTKALWTFAATRPIAPYLFSMCAGLSAGPAFACEHHDRSPLAVATHALPPVAELLDTALSAELFQQPLLYYERALGVRYPDDKYDVAFLPRFPVALAFGAPGLLSVRDEVVNLNDKPETYLATLIAHELAHAWFGGLIELQPPDNEWLEEAITTYVSRSALEARHPGITPWDATTSRTLPDHAYTEFAAPLKRLETMIGRQSVMDGLGHLLRHHANETVTKYDLARSWSLASSQDIREWAANQLVPRAPDDA